MSRIDLPTGGWWVSLTGPARRLEIDPAERALGGRVCGILWALGGATLLVFPALPGVTRAHVVWVIALAVVSLAWGLGSVLAVDWKRAHPLLIQVSTLAALAIIGAAVASTGGSRSAAWIFLFWVGLFAAYFYERSVAIAYLIACVAVQALPLIYDGHVLHDGFVAVLLTACAGFALIGGAVIAGKARLAHLRARAELLAAEQGALRRVATAVVGGASAAQIYELAAVEAASLLGADGAGIMRCSAAGQVTVVATWANECVQRLQLGLVLDVLDGGDLDRAATSRGPVRTDELLPDAVARHLGHVTTLVSPVIVDGEVWGIVAIGSATAGRFDAAHERQLVAFCELLATAISNLSERALLATEALTDPLTGLANHRAVRQRLEEELARAIRHDRTVSVAMIDIDHFKEINDSGGHDAGDRALVEVARCLRALARAEDTLGRPGGDEFIWILPDATAEEALLAVERARALIARTVSGPGRTTTSAGVCDSDTTAVPAELVRCADVALYRSKALGRDQAQLYDCRTSGVSA
jgi:diguanylate cyclase (GGDEF)-like protein